MNNFIPKMYKKSILDIDYKKLKQRDIKILLFDFDNTIIQRETEKIDKDILKLIKKLKKEFLIYIISNSLNEKKLNKICTTLGIPYIKNSHKPLKKGFKKLRLRNIENSQIAMIGDQVITDVWGANRMGYFSILIDPITNNEVIFTKINRLLEKLIFKKNSKLKRGRYYG